MGWVREARVYTPSGEAPWLASHASVPFAEPLGGSLVRAWFSPRDKLNRSYIWWVVFDLEDPTRIIERAIQPILELGRPGSFDDSGTMMSWITNVNGQRQLFYIGWSVRSTVPFHVAIGVAVEQADGSWEKIAGPVLDRSVKDPFFCSNPCVLCGSSDLTMWYLSGLGWEKIGERYSASYQIRRATSRDGVSWLADSVPAVQIKPPEYAIARPSVLRQNNQLMMWFSVRTRDRPYRLGAALSEDGCSWHRAPELANFQPSSEGWDSEMIAYPHVFEQAGNLWMLYCGNGFGHSGFGLARWY